MPGKDRQFLMDLYTLATVGLNIVAGTFIGLGMGWYIDHKIFDGRTVPWFTLIFLLFGIVAGFRNMYSIVVSKGDAGVEEDREHKEDEEEKDKEGK